MEVRPVQALKYLGGFSWILFSLYMNAMYQVAFVQILLEF